MNAAPSFTRETAVGDIVAAHPSLARLFEHLGIDYCCKGKQALAEACAQHGLDAATTLALLQSATSALGDNTPEFNAANLTLSQLADHIEATHHAHTKAELPRLVELANKVAAKHGEHDPRLFEVAVGLRCLTEEMFDHMEKEEIALFPLVRRIETATAGSCACDMLATPIRQMEIEHDDAGRAITHLRELTDDFSIQDACCNTHRALLAGLAAFEADLHRHVHKENSILFPRALALAAQSSSRHPTS